MEIRLRSVLKEGDVQFGHTLNQKHPTFTASNLPLSALKTIKNVQNYGCQL